MSVVMQVRPVSPRAIAAATRKPALVFTLLYGGIPA
jgi:hypothetical protein